MDYSESSRAKALFPPSPYSQHFVFFSTTQIAAATIQVPLHIISQYPAGSRLSSFLPFSMMSSIAQEGDVKPPKVDTSDHLNPLPSHIGSDTKAKCGDETQTAAGPSNDATSVDLSHEKQPNTDKGLKTSNVLGYEKSKLKKTGFAFSIFFSWFSRAKPQPKENGPEAPEKGAVESGAAESNFNLVNMPVDIIFDIVDYLDPADREILRFTCRAFYYGLPALNFKHEHDGRCMLIQVFRRLYGSSLMPDVREGRTLLDNSDVKEKLSDHCGLCSITWPPGSWVHCPFHKPLEYASPPPLFSFKRPWHYMCLSHIRWAFALRKGLTQESYQKIIAKDVENGRLPRRVRRFSPVFSTYIASWNDYLANVESVRWTDGTYFGSAGNPNTNGLTKKKGAKPDPEVIKLHCCGHCLNILPENNPERMCGMCDCGYCKQTSIEMLRIPRDDMRTKFVPLAKVDESHVEKIKAAKKAGIKKEPL
ncbi:hypothetical protein DIZ76_014903 [Coccidioides immitis]|nr:hypothetical protein DIZ76_014903 [Coccidioides immitis]